MAPHRGMGGTKTWTARLAAVLGSLRRRLGRKGYRPERSYMRGAGNRDASSANSNRTG